MTRSEFIDAMLKLRTLKLLRREREEQFELHISIDHGGWAEIVEAGGHRNAHCLWGSKSWDTWTSPPTTAN